MHIQIKDVDADTSLQPATYIQPVDALQSRWELAAGFDRDLDNLDIDAILAQSFNYHQRGHQKWTASRSWAALALPVGLAAAMYGYYQEYQHLSQVEHAKWLTIMSDPPPFCDGSKPAGAIEVLTHSFNYKHRQQCDAYFYAKVFGPATPNVVDTATELVSRSLIAPFRAVVRVLESVTWALQLFLVLALVVVFVKIAFNASSQWRTAVSPLLPWAGTPHRSRYRHSRGS
jgi:hypothetical protein